MKTDPTPAERIARHWGRRLRERREDRQLTQIALAELVHRDQTTVSRHERGDGSWTPEVMLSYAVALGTTCERLFPWIDGIEQMERFRQQSAGRVLA